MISKGHLEIDALLGRFLVSTANIIGEKIHIILYMGSTYSMLFSCTVVEYRRE